MARDPGSSPPTLYLIDGYAQFFRAYHAIRTPMTSPVTKEPTNMTFGFVGMLLKLLRAGAGGGAGAAVPAASRMERPPDFLAVALDVSGDTETFRSTIDPQYKAQRPPPPEDLFPQVERCLKLLEAIGVPTVGVEGFEADDAIATIVERLKRERPDVRIRIVSKDKDLKQLLEPGRVELYDVHTDTLIDTEALRAETGLAPRQVIDMLALMGDTVDNVKGVEGVGPKTAAELIARYGSLDALIEHAVEVKGKRGEALRASLDRLPINVKLVSLVHDAPITFALDDAATSRLRLEALLPILRELGFNRYQDEVKALLGRPPDAPDEAVQAAMNAASNPPAAAPARAVRPRDGDLADGLFAGLGGSGFNGAPSSVRPAHAGYRAVRTPRELGALVKTLAAAEVFALDTETTSLHPHDARLCGLSFSVEANAGWYVPVRSPEPGSHLDEATVLAALRPLLEDTGRPKCGHNLKYDLLVLRNAGIRLRGLAFDSMVASYVIDASRSSHALDALALALLGHTNISLSELIGSGANQRSFETVPVDAATQYAAEDADVAFRLREVMLPQLRATGLIDLFVSVEMPLVEVLADLEWNGVLVDPAELDRQRGRLETRIKTLRAQIDDAAFAAIGRTFNPDSPKQLAAALFGKKSDSEPGLGLKPVKKTKTGNSTDIEVLETLADDASITTPIPRLIVDYRQLTKLVSTYLVALKEAIHPRTGRIHASFNQTVAVTGRLASSDPNLQNIPIRSEVGREIRRAFVAPAGAPGAGPARVFISADYSQIELRLLGHLSRDPALIEAFHQGQDIHSAVAAQINRVPLDQVTRAQRDGAKMVNFGIVYGITPFGLARRLGIPNDEAASIIDAYKRRFAGITTFLQECIEQARRHGYVETILKRRRPIPDIDSSNPARRSFAERTAINSVVQGSAADLIKLAMINIHRLLPEPPLPVEHGEPGGASTRGTDPARRPDPALHDVLMLLQIHDELVFEAPRDTAEGAQAVIVREMEQALTLSVPLKVDSGIAPTWFDGE
ncbi:MAG: DNA polymerase I [Phycisphaerales bacterium]